MACQIQVEATLPNSGYDGYVLVAENVEALLKHKLNRFYDPLRAQLDIDGSVDKDGTCVRVEGQINRVVYRSTGPLDRDYDDVRRYYDAAGEAIKKALKVGMKSPVLVVATTGKFKHEKLVALLGALQVLYVPLEIREDVPEKKMKVNHLGFLGEEETVKLAKMLEHGRLVTRDIGGSDPERMAPPRVEEYVRSVFNNSNIKVDVISDYQTLCKEYPLFSAVNRCAAKVPRHQGRVIYLTYEGEGPIEKTVYLVGKGVTYDTGGADIKAGGVMAGMHRDKCGSASVAGFMKIISQLKPKNLKVVGAMAMVRNSVGSECYVADEIVTSRAGVRVRVGNTDAEGRMAMADVLCHLKEQALTAVNPELMTIATLTGHVILAYGESYTAVMENGPARLSNFANLLNEAGSDLADPFEISTIRREDFKFHEGKSEYEDVLQACNQPSTRTPRGHQSPSAFLIMASGLDKHGKDSTKPLKYAHLDVAGSSGPFPGVPTGSPILALTKNYIPNVFNLN